MCGNVAPVARDVAGGGECLWHGPPVLFGRFLRVVVGCASAVGALPALAEAYVVSGSNTLVLEDAGGLTQVWTASCDVTDGAVDAVLTTAGKDLRFFAAPEQPLEVGVDTTVHAIADGASGTYGYAAVPGARVMARLTVRCGTADVFDEAVLDSAPVTTEPVIVAPVRILDAVTLQDIGGDGIPLGSTVELVGIEVLANPRAGEFVDVVFSGAGVDVTLTYAEADFVSGRLAISPQLTPTAVGDLIVEARFEGAAAEALTLQVVPAADEPPDDEARAAIDGGCGAASAGLPWATGLLLWRRRRRSRG